MIVQGDLFDVLPTLDAESVDAVVCDPPYGLEFMGKAWDKLWDARAHGGSQTDVVGSDGVRRSRGMGKPGPTYQAGPQAQQWHERWAREVFRVLKPGGYLVAFGGTRTFHRLSCGVEDAGFEIRDCLSWLYGSGFPKSLDVGKAIDKMAGATREVVGPSAYAARANTTPRAIEPDGEGKRISTDARLITVPATDAARQWDGWGTALKPAYEPIVLARKPLRGTVAANVLAYGTGALHIDACRIAGLKPDVQPIPKATDPTIFQTPSGTHGGEMTDEGRWPANVLLDADAAAQLDAQSGESESASGETTYRRAESTSWVERGGSFTPGREWSAQGYGDRGGASRFFYCAKPGRGERDDGCYDLPARSGGDATDRVDGSAGTESPRAGAGRTGGARNIHPTVKPVEVMAWLVKLVTPVGGLVLDPFCGSGTTGVACAREGMRFLGIEREAEYVAIAERRIAASVPLFADLPTPPPPAEAAPVTDVQPSLWGDEEPS